MYMKVLTMVIGFPDYEVKMTQCKLSSLSRIKLMVSIKVQKSQKYTAAAVIPRCKHQALLCVDRQLNVLAKRRGSVL